MRESAHHLALHGSPGRERDQHRSRRGALPRRRHVADVLVVQLDERRHLEVVVEVVAERAWAHARREQQLRRAERVTAHHDARARTS